MDLDAYSLIVCEFYSLGVGRPYEKLSAPLGVPEMKQSLGALGLHRIHGERLQIGGQIEIELFRAYVQSHLLSGGHI